MQANPPSRATGETNVAITRLPANDALDLWSIAKFIPCPHEHYTMN